MIEAEDIVAAYSDAAVPEDDILCEVEKDLGEDEDFLGRQKRRRRKEFMRERRCCRGWSDIESGLPRKL